MRININSLVCQQWLILSHCLLIVYVFLEIWSWIIDFQYRRYNAYQYMKLLIHFLMTIKLMLALILPSLESNQDDHRQQRNNLVSLCCLFCHFDPDAIVTSRGFPAELGCFRALPESTEKLRLVVVPIAINSCVCLG